MPDTTLNRTQYEALKSLLADLEDIEDLGARVTASRYNLAGSISKDNMNELRKFVELDEL